jgi:gp16 family phage-associated protein
VADRASEIKGRFEAEGISIAEWARENGFNVRTVYAVLYGELKAKRGVSHRITVALGLKPAPRPGRWNNAA